MSSSTHIERLRRLIAILRADLPENVIFNISTYDSPLAGGKRCMCAMGLAWRDPWMNEQGLHRKLSISQEEEFFGISWDDYEYLFMPSGYEGNPTKEDVANKIERLVGQRT